MLPRCVAREEITVIEERELVVVGGFFAIERNERQPPKYVVKGVPVTLDTVAHDRVPAKGNGFWPITLTTMSPVPSSSSTANR